MAAETWVLNQLGFWESEGRSNLYSRDELVYGTYRPDGSTTGAVSPIGDLDVVAGDVNITTPGYVFEGYHVQGKVTINAANVTVRNCHITGETAGPSTPSYSLVTAYSNQVSSSTIIDCTLAASVATVYSGNGGQGRDITFERCNIYGTVDGMGIQNENASLLGNWIHDLAWYAWSPVHSDGTHNDGVQVHGGSNFLIRGNSIEVGYKGTSCIIVTQDAGVTSNLTIDKNWLISTWTGDRTTACAVGLNISASGSGGVAMSNVSVTDNQFSELTKWKINHAGLITPTTYDTISELSGNVYVGTSTPAKITRA